MLFHHDVVAHRQAKSGALARGFGGEEGIEHFLLYFLWDPRPVVPDADFDPVSEIFCGRAQRRLVTLFAGFLALGGCVKAIRNQIEKHPRDLLRVQIDHACIGVEVALQGDIEAGFLRSRTMIGKVETVFDDCVDVGRPMLARTFTRMQQHVLDD